MPEPSTVELLLKIDRLEKALQIAKQAEINLQNAELGVIQRDKEISGLRQEIVRQGKNVEGHQKTIEDLKNIIGNQNNVIHNLTIESNNLKKDNKSLQDSIKVTCSQRDSCLQKLEGYSTLQSNYQLLQQEIIKYKKFLQNMLNSLNSVSVFNTELISSIQALLLVCW